MQVIGPSWASASHGQPHKVIGRTKKDRGHRNGHKGAGADKMVVVMIIKLKFKIVMRTGVISSKTWLYF